MREFHNLPIAERLTTGAIKINNDWPGLFIRGHDCIQLKYIFEKILEGRELNFIDLSYIKTYLEVINYEVVGEKFENNK